MASERQTVCVARTSFFVAAADGRFPQGVVREGQLLLEADPIVQGTPEHLWTSVGTADVATAQLITDLGRMATLRDLLPRLGPIDGGEARPVAPRTEPTSEPDGDLPGNLTWPKIEASYRRLAGSPTGWRSRRRRPDEPSRPEVAADLDVSVATLKRACDAAGKSTRWPPSGL
jgi:hypothetical protein